MIADSTHTAIIARLTNENERLRAQIDDQLALDLVAIDGDDRSSATIIAALQCRLDDAHAIIRKTNDQVYVCV